MKSRPGYHYEAKVEVAFENEVQARSFCMANTVIGERVALDLEDQEVLDLFVTEDRLLCEVIFPDALGDVEGGGMQAEVDAARHVGAEITISCRWVKNA